MEWTTLLSTARLGDKITMPFEERNAIKISEFDKDYQRIITSASFRRLQDKTQVFPLDKSDFVRTRLTHSIEVAFIGKQLSALAFENLARFGKRNDTHSVPSEEQKVHIGNILMCAGLLHDIGNPPFGHFGEFVLRDWFKQHFADPSFMYKSTPISKCLTGQMSSDFLCFEGNAQAIRILTKLHHVDSSCGLNLTVSVLATLIKYPVDSLSVDSTSSNLLAHKLGFYFSEKEEFEKIMSQSGLCTGSFTSRHPLTFLLEASDDIAYSTADLEDAMKKGLFNINEFINYYKDELSKIKVLEKRAGNFDEKKFDKSLTLINELATNYTALTNTGENEFTCFQKWIMRVREWLLYCAAYGFVHNYSSIMDGTYQNDIVKGTYHEYTMTIIRNIMNEHVFSSTNILKLELAAQTILTSLLDKFIPATINLDCKNAQSKAEKKLISIISGNYKDQYYRSKKENDDQYNLYLRLLLVTDYICGMTDSFAKNLYQELNGIYS